jgi:hypothetical protein
MNIPAKVGYQAPREDVARPFKAREYNSSGYYNVYKGAGYKGVPVGNGSAEFPLKQFAEKELERSVDPTVTARTAMHPRDGRLNAHKAAYGEGKWKGESYIVAGGKTAVTPQKPRPHTVPAQVGSDGSLSHPSYGQGEYVRQDRTEHPDLAGFTKLSKRGLHDSNNLTARSAKSRGDIEVTTNGYYPAAPPQLYGGGHYASQIVQAEASGVAGIHYGTRKGGVSEAKYLPTHNEAVMGHNARLSDYGGGAYASPQKPMVHGRYGVDHPWEARRDVAGYGAYVTPRSGIY